MSRRLRVEEEKAKQLNFELQEEEDKLKLQKEKIFGPLVWRRLVWGVRIQDMKPMYYDEAWLLIEEHFLKEDVIFRNTKIFDDPESKRALKERLLFAMKDNCSIIALDESNEDTIAGVLLLKTVKKCDFGCVFSRIMLGDGLSYQSILDFVNYIGRKVDIFEQFQCDIYLRYYMLCIKPEYRAKGLGFHMMNVGLEVARHLNISIVMGIFDSFKLQKIAKKLSMQVLYEINYVSWSDKSGELVFCDPGAGNYTCAIMAGEVRLPEPDPPPIKASKSHGSKGKLTRSDKKKEKEKIKAKKK